MLFGIEETAVVDGNSDGAPCRITVDDTEEIVDIVPQVAPTWEDRLARIPEFGDTLPQLEKTLPPVGEIGADREAVARLGVEKKKEPEEEGQRIVEEERSENAVFGELLGLDLVSGDESPADRLDGL